MWEIALLIVAIAFAALVLFLAPTILKFRDAARELELTLREARGALQKVQEISLKAEGVVDQGVAIVGGARNALASVGRVAAGIGIGSSPRVTAGLLGFIPVAVAVFKLISRRRRRDHE